MASSIHSDSGDVGFQIAPMVDVVFVLLLFFMASAGLRQKERFLSINVPGQSGDLGVSAPLFVDIDAAGKVTINNLTVAEAGQRDLSRLSDWLRRMVVVSYNRDPVIIRPTADARHEQIISVLDACAEAGVQKVSFL